MSLFIEKDGYLFDEFGEAELSVDEKLAAEREKESGVHITVIETYKDRDGTEHTNKFRVIKNSAEDLVEYLKSNPIEEFHGGSYAICLNSVTVLNKVWSEQARTFNLNVLMMAVAQGSFDKATEFIKNLTLDDLEDIFPKHIKRNENIKNILESPELLKKIKESEAERDAKTDEILSLSAERKPSSLLR